MNSSLRNSVLVFDLPWMRDTRFLLFIFLYFLLWICETSVLRVLKRIARIRTRERNVYLLLKSGATQKRAETVSVAILEEEAIV